MPFKAGNGRREKRIRSGIDFPVKREKAVVAVLAVPKDAPNSVKITLVDGVIIKLGSGKPDIKKDTTLEARSFEIRDPKSGAVVSIVYEEDITLEP